METRHSVTPELANMVLKKWVQSIRRDWASAGIGTVAVQYWIFQELRARQPTFVTGGSGSEPGSRISIYSAERARFNSRTGCPVAGVPRFVHLHCFGKRVRRCRNARLCRDRSTSAASRRGPAWCALAFSSETSRYNSGPVSSPSRCSDRGIMQAHDIISRSPVSVRRVCARI